METSADPVFKAFGKEFPLTGINLPEKIKIKHSVPEDVKEILKKGEGRIEENVTVMIGEKTLVRNKELLCSQIPYFRALFESNLSESAKREVTLSTSFYDFDLSTIERLFDYSYTGRLTITVRNVQELMLGANFLQIESVMDECAEFMRRRLTIHNVICLYYFCKMIGYGKISSHIFNFIDANFVPISSTIEFRKILVDDLADILQRNSLRVDEEKQVFEAVNRWIRSEADRTQHAARLLKCIRCTLLDKSFIEKTVSKAKWVKKDQACIDVVNEAKETINNVKMGSKSVTFNTTARQCENDRHLFLSVDLPGAPSENAPHEVRTHLYDPLTDCWTKFESYWLSQQPDTVNVKSHMLSLACKGEVLQMIDTLSNERHTGKDYIAQNKPHSIAVEIKGRVHPAEWTIDGISYAAGGKNENGNVLSGLDVYNAAKNEWNSLTPMSTPRYASAFWSHRGKLYVVGGRNNQNQLLSDGECYDPATDRWTPIAPTKSKRRLGKVTTLNDQAYVIGGRNEERIIADPARSGVFVGKSCGKIFVFGGTDSSNHSIKTAEMYDPEMNSWEERGNIPIETDYYGVVNYIVPASFAAPVANLEELWINHFRSFSLHEELIKSIVDFEFRHPYKVQTECIPPAIEGRDVLCKAEAGTGKTTMNIISVLQQLKPVNGEISALFLCPTRKQTTTIESEIKRFSKYYENIKAASFVGGVSVKFDAEILTKDQPHIVLGTPARIYALIQSGSLDLHDIKHVIMDDGDKMISNSGILNTVEKIFNSTPRKKQVMISTETISHQLRRFCEKYMQKKLQRFEFLNE